MIKAALFDLDGTLIDSMWVWDRLLVDFLAEFGIVPSESVLSKVAHMSLRQSSAYVKEQYQLPMEAIDVYQSWIDRLHRAYAEEISLKPGAKEFLKALKAHGVRLGLVTACDDGLCHACLTHHGIDALFDTIVYADDVGRGKDAPDIYLEALRRLDCRTEQAVLFEDILVAVRTAKKIGLRTVAVQDGQTDRAAMRQEADRYIRDYNELLNKIDFT